MKWVRSSVHKITGIYIHSQVNLTLQRREPVRSKRPIAERIKAGSRMAHGPWCAEQSFGEQAYGEMQMWGFVRLRSVLVGMIEKGSRAGCFKLRSRVTRNN